MSQRVLTKPLIPIEFFKKDLTRIQNLNSVTKRPLNIQIQDKITNALSRMPKRWSKPNLQ